MSDTFPPEKTESTIPSSLEDGSDVLQRVGNRIAGDVRAVARGNLSYILIGSVVVAAVIGFLIAQREEERVRDRWAENFRRDATDWLNKQGRRVSAPIREQIEHVADRAAGYGLSLTPKRRKFLNLF
jgi:hypothetical protein